MSMVPSVQGLQVDRRAFAPLKIMVQKALTH
jgi:hypothetical protein